MVQTRSASTAARATPPPPSRSSPSSSAAAPRTRASGAAMATTTATGGRVLSHTPSTAALAWLAVSLPLVAWDTGYVLLRPRSMPGGSLHWPLWVPYELYGRVDQVYGFKQWHAGNGFTAAQASLNLVESLMYLAYVWIWSANATPVASGGGQQQQRAAVTGRPAAVALLVFFSALVMTVSKTVLYWLNESWSGFDNIGHNTWADLCLLWIIPNGAWLVVPGYLIYTYGSEILEALAPAPSRAALKSE